MSSQMKIISRRCRSQGLREIYQSDLNVAIGHYGENLHVSEDLSRKHRNRRNYPKNEKKCEMVNLVVRRVKDSSPPKPDTWSDEYV